MRGRIATEDVEDDVEGTNKSELEPHDWRDENAVNAVKDQAQCGSCWAFSAIASLESAHFLTSGKLEVFAEQQLVDCDTHSNGCGGGFEDKAMDYFISKPANYEADYPYTAMDGVCSEKLHTTKVHSAGHVAVHKNDVDALKEALEQWPVSVAIDASGMAFN